MKKSILFILLLSTVIPLRAQFYSNGCGPARQKQSQIMTENYRIVFPSGNDSLALEYARMLEKVRVPVGGSCGYLPNQMYSKRMPVILFPDMSESNGMVTWTPRRMELYTTPDFSTALSVPWTDHLCIHESRHVAQMQFSAAGYFKPLHWLLGQISEGVLSAVYPGDAFMEGDAVVAETSLTESGRGRSADFLEYWRACLSEGERRDYWQWRYGSLNRYCPGKYQAGYVLIGGIRSLWDVPDFTGAYYRRIAANFLPVANLQKTIKDVTGTTLPKAFARVCDTMQEQWNTDALRRSPLTPETRLTKDGKYYTDLKAAGFLGGELYAFGEGIASTRALYRVDADGSLKKISSLSYSTSELKASDAASKVFFSEVIPDHRWELRSSSVVCSIDRNGHYRQITRNTRYFNPTPSPDGTRLAVINSYAEGGNSLDIIDAETGLPYKSIAVPEGMQLLETEWTTDCIYALGLTSEGQGIYNATDGFMPVLLPVRAQIKNLTSYCSCLYYICDATGENELYTLENGSAVMLTSTAQGISSPKFSDTTLVCSSLTSGGRHLSLISLADLRPRESFNADPYPFATSLSAGEKVLPGQTPEPEIGPVEKYSRLRHLFNVHAWAPMYIDYDSLSSLSLETVSSVADLGATVFFQNELSTLEGYAAYRLDLRHGGRSSAHLNFKYSGLMPVLEFKGSAGEGDATGYSVKIKTEDGKSFKVIESSNLGKAHLSGTLKAYVPLTFNSRGILRGVIPQVNCNITNDTFENGLWGRFTASLRAYTMTSTPHSCLYPRLGVGAELGYSTRMEVSKYIRPLWYLSLYGYLPGIMPTHGIKLAALHTEPSGNASFCENYLSILPRGYVAGYLPVAYWTGQSRYTVDYVFPFASMDWSGLCPAFYLRNLEGGLHLDCSVFREDDGKPGNLLSAGATLKLRLENFLWAPFPTRVGVTYSRNFGSLCDYFLETWPSCGKDYVGFVFSVDL